MKPLNRFLQIIHKPARSTADPVFGEMQFQQGSWVTYTDLPHAREPVEVSVWGKEEPSTLQQNVFRKLVRGYDDVEPLIETALFDELQAALESDSALDIDDHYLTDGYLPRNAGEIWKMAFPVGIDIYPAGYSSEYDCRIYYAFPLDREHNRSVFLSDGRVVLVTSE